MGRKRKPISAEEFAAWRADPVTQVVFKAHAALADLQREGWLQSSWESGQPDPLILRELKTRAEAYRAIVDMTYEDLMEPIE